MYLKVLLHTAISLTLKLYDNHRKINAATVLSNTNIPILFTILQEVDLLRSPMPELMLGEISEQKPEMSSPIHSEAEIQVDSSIEASQLWLGFASLEPLACDYEDGLAITVHQKQNHGSLNRSNTNVMYDLGNIGIWLRRKHD